MQARRPSTGLTPLSIVLPHPQLPRRKSSLLSLVTSPRTPRTSGSPTCSSLFFSANRKSTDSWNSSNQDLVDDLDYDWKPDQILLLRRTLDALPPHLMTPFNGPIPPSNLLDKIARGVTQAKGEDWPHSLRATRVKLIELARTIAEEDSKPRKTIPEDSAMDCSESYFAEGDVLQQTTNIGIGKMGLGLGLGPRRPLYRQSSMDFLDTSDPQDNDTINRLSTRLQKADRFIPNASSHPYSRSHIQRRSSSPPRPSHVPSLISGSSSSTLASLSTAGSHPHLRRSASTISSSTTSNSRMSLSSAGGLPPIAADPRVQRVRRSESFCGPSMPSRQPVKRAPSYGALAQEARDKMPEDDLAAPYPSSDEEEKIRTRRAKKARTASTGSPPLSPSPAPSSPSSATQSPDSSRRMPKAASPEAAGPSKRTTKKKASVKASESQSGVADLPTKLGRERPKGMNAKRNPSMFGAELPRLASSVQQPETLVATPPPSLSAAPLLAPHQATEKVRTLRRVRRLPPARRISFGSLIPPVGEDGHEADMEECEEDRGLGSAFQLR
jgi:transcription factor SPN1